MARCEIAMYIRGIFFDTPKNHFIYPNQQRMKTLQLLLALLLTTVALNGQKVETIFNQTDLRITGAWGTAAYNFSSFNGDDWTLIRGGMGGVELNRNLFLGWGGYETRDEIPTDVGTTSANLRYNGPVVSFSPNSTKLIHPRFTFLTGRGKASLTEGDAGTDRMFVFQPSAGLEINVFQWFRVGFEGGYRFVGESTKLNLTSGDLSAPFAQIELRFGLSWGN